MHENDILSPDSPDSPARYRSTKRLSGFPCAHRRHAHHGHCAWVHGYSREFTFVFSCTSLQHGTGFVLDFGVLSDIKAWLTDKFDHTLLLDSSDPLLPDFKALDNKGACKLTILPDVGMEGTARYVFDYVSKWVVEYTGGRVSLESVECRENENNSGIYYGGSL